MKVFTLFRSKAFPLILICSIASILIYLNVPIVKGPHTVTFTVTNVRTGSYGEILADININASAGSAIIGWSVDVKVNPDVLAVGYDYGGGYVYWITAGGPPAGYFLYDWAALSGNDTTFDPGTRNNETGTIVHAVEAVNNWANFPPGTGADGTGLLATLYFTPVNVTTAYSPIRLENAKYYTSWNAPAEDIHDATVVNGHYGTPIHDVATTSVSTEPLVNATRGTVVSIRVKGRNLGGYNETFTVTAYYNKTATEQEPIANRAFTLTPLERLDYEWVNVWDTEYVELGSYAIKAVHNLTDANSDNDDATTTIEITRPEWDVVVTAIAAPSEATAGGIVNMSVTVANEGTKPITNVTVTVFYDGTIEEQNFTEPDVLAQGETIVLAFEWDTTGVAPGNYTIEAIAVPPLLLNSTPVSERVEYNNNATTDVEIKIPDFNGNGVVDAVDLFLFAKAYGAPPNLQQIDLNVNADDETRAAGWTRVGVNPYLNATDYPTHYAHATGSGDLIGDFGFEDSGKSIESMSSVTIQLYAKQSGNNRELEVFVWDGSSWTSLGGQIISTSWGWVSWTATAVLDTWAEIDGAKIYIETKNAGTYEVDHGRLRVDYVTHEPADLDYDGDVDSDDLDLFLKNYGKTS